MPVSIKGTGGGSVTLSAAAAATDTTLTIPNVTGTVLQSGTAVTVAQGGTGLTSVGTSGNVLTSNGTAWVSSAPSSGGSPSAIGQIPFSTDGSTYTATQKITQGTAVASTSGTSIDFTSIPSWVKRVTVMFSGVSTNGTTPIQLQLGTSGGIETTGYDSDGVAVTNAAGVGGVSSTTGLVIGNGVNASTVSSGIATLCLLGSNKWMFSAALSAVADNRVIFGAGGKTLSGVLDRVRITTTSGTDTFDAGSINILYE